MKKLKWKYVLCRNLDGAWFTGKTSGAPDAIENWSVYLDDALLFNEPGGKKGSVLPQGAFVAVRVLYEMKELSRDLR